jgi:NAD-dependent DNA ligase
MTAILDDNAQPNSGFNAKRRLDRAVHEMLGLVKGVIVDGEVTAGEAQYLAHWINANPEAVKSWPGNAMAERLRRIFKDKRVDQAEREDLLYFLQELTGEDHDQKGVGNPTTRLPLDTPPPVLTFKGHEFVFTGKFVWGTRTACESAVTARGGIAGKDVSFRTSVLVLGDQGSRDWAHTSFGRKIEKAMKYRGQGATISIIEESHWCAHL